MVVRSLYEVKQQLCALVPGWVTATVRVALLVDCSDTARSLTLENNAHAPAPSVRFVLPSNLLCSATIKQSYQCQTQRDALFTLMFRKLFVMVQITNVPQYQPYTFSEKTNHIHYKIAHPINCHRIY